MAIKFDVVHEASGCHIEDLNEVMSDDRVRILVKC